MTKILILRFSSIGDIVLTSPVARNIKNQISGVEVHYCTKLKFKSVVEHNPYIDKTYFLDNNFKELLSQLRKENYDYVIDLHHNFRTSLIKLVLNKPSSSFNKLNFRKWLLVNLKINILPDVHIVDRYMDTVKKLDVKNDGLGLDYFIHKKDELEISQLPVTHQKGYIAFAIGAQHATKKLPQEKILELCKKINYPIILLGDKKDGEVGNYIEQELKNTNPPIYNACGKYSLNQSAGILKEAQIVFSHDTGLMHIAAAFKKEIYSIWGNTTPKFGMYPYKTKYHVLENENLNCRPCSKIGFSKCPKGHFKCMKGLSFERIELR